MALSALDKAVLLTKIEAGDNKAVADYLRGTASDIPDLTDFGVTATAIEINNIADVSARAEELTESGAVTAGVVSVELNHATVAIAATIADLSDHQGLFVVKNTSATGTAAHTVTAAAGTWDGTNNVITLDLLNEAIVFWIDSAGNGTVVENVGSVVLS